MLLLIKFFRNKTDRCIKKILYLFEANMNIKQISLILIALGALIFILGFLGEILAFIFARRFLTVAFFAILIGLILLGYSIFKESKDSTS